MKRVLERIRLKRLFRFSVSLSIQYKLDPIRNVCRLNFYFIFCNDKLLERRDWQINVRLLNGTIILKLRAPNGQGEMFLKPHGMKMKLVKP